MVTSQNIKEIFDKLTQNETFCRLVAYGDNPLGSDKSDIVGSDGWQDLMRDIIRFSPQISDLETEERTRICLYKTYTKLKGLQRSAVIRQGMIQIDIYVPNRLVKEDFRVYSIEDSIVGILDGSTITGVSPLDYSEGYFTALPPISGYAVYKMMFTIEEGRPYLNGRR
jgi:hypothetical protein